MQEKKQDSTDKQSAPKQDGGDTSNSPEKQQVHMDVQEGNIEYDDTDPHGLTSRHTGHDRQGKGEAPSDTQTAHS